MPNSASSTRDALAQQVGIRDASPYELTADEQGRAESFRVPDGAPSPTRAGGWSIRSTPWSWTAARTAGLRPGEHARRSRRLVLQGSFPRDPVWPGSSGVGIVAATLEGRGRERAWAVAIMRPFRVARHWAEPSLDLPRPDCPARTSVVTVQAEIKACDDSSATGSSPTGSLEVDGKVIYQMNDFDPLAATGRLISRRASPAASRASARHEVLKVLSIRSAMRSLRSWSSSAELERRLEGFTTRSTFRRGSSRRLTGIVERRWWEQVTGSPTVRSRPAAVRSRRRSLVPSRSTS